MKQSAWRIFKRKHAATALTGEGARQFGGRWNSKGTAVFYAASTCSLAALEILVHVQRQQLLDYYLVTQITFDSRHVQTFPLTRLPSNWKSEPPPPSLKAIGDHWAAGLSSAVLRVPSAIVDTEFNYLFNPLHAAFGDILFSAPQPFSFDPRLLK